MKRIALLLLACAAARAQYVAINASVDTPAGSVTLLNGKPNSQSGAGVPSGSCTTAKDFYLDTSAGRFYYCVASAWVIVPLQLNYTPLNPANNLSDVANAATARTNLGLGTAATQASSAFQAALGFTPLNVASNLSDLANTTTSRTNLGLGSFAILNNPMTTAGDWMVAGASGSPVRLAVPSAGTWCPSLSGTTWSFVACPGAGGGLTSVGLSLPAWWSLSNNPLTVNGTIALSMATGQTSHQVIGTCGAATSFGPCALVPADIPTLNQSTTGNAATATALASTPTLCTTGNAPTGISANGNATGCAAIGGGGGGTGNAASVVTATFSATPTFTCPSSSAGTVTSFKLSTALTANITSPTLASCTTGQTLNFTFTQDATGGRTVAMPTGFTQACTVNPVASSITNMSFYWDGATAQKLSCSTDSGPSFSGPESDVAGAGTPAASKGICGWDQTNHIFSCKQNNSATVSNAVVPDAGAANNFLTGVTAAGAITKARPTCSNVSDAGVFCSAAAVTESQVTNLTTDLAGKAQIFFGTAAPGSVAGNLPGAQFTDTTNHHQYVCNAPAGTAAPACTSVTAAGWLQVDGTALGFTAENVANKSTDTTLGGGSPSNTLYGSQAAVKSYIDAHVGGTGVGRSVLSATWTAIPDFTCQAQTATWTGVTTADTVVIGAPSSYTSGLTPPVGWVTSANTVTINICNFSGGPVTPGSLSLSATLAIYNLSGSGTIDYTSIVDGACQNSTFTLTGVSAGDPLVPKWPATLESTIMPVGMVATAANTVQARVCNFSGGPIDPASNTFGASVAK